MCGYMCWRFKNLSFSSYECADGVGVGVGVRIVCEYFKKSGIVFLVVTNMQIRY